MKKFKADWFASPLNIGRVSSGDISIRHKIETDEVSIIGMRQAYVRQLAGEDVRPLKLKLDRPLTIHQLVDKKRGVWMSDTPEELNQIMEALHTIRPRGRVLVGGLGLGLLPFFMAIQKGPVKEIVIVERDKDVIDLVRRSGHLVKGLGPAILYPDIKIVHADIYKWLANPAKKHVFDYYMLDTWQGTSEHTWWEEVMPLRRIIRNRFGSGARIHCWAEDIMASQIKRQIMGSNSPHWYYHETGMSSKDAAYFIDGVGLPAWERRWGKFYSKKMKK